MSEPSLSFRIEDARILPGIPGVVLIGPPKGDGTLNMGDRLRVPSSDGFQIGVCAEFPLIHLAPERADWVRVAVTGVTPERILVGGTAEACDP